MFRFFSRIAVNFSFNDFSLIAYKVKVPYWKQEFNLSLVDALNQNSTYSETRGFGRFLCRYHLIISNENKTKNIEKSSWYLLVYKLGPLNLEPTTQLLISFGITDNVSREQLTQSIQKAFQDKN